MAVFHRSPDAPHAPDDGRRPLFLYTSGELWEAIDREAKARTVSRGAVARMALMVDPAIRVRLMDIATEKAAGVYTARPRGRKFTKKDSA